MVRSIIHGPTRLSEQDVYLFREGTHYRLYDKLGSHPGEYGGLAGTLFAVWAPNADAVSVIGDFNGWDGRQHQLAVRWDSSGIWEGFVPAVQIGARYKFRIHSRFSPQPMDKADPFARAGECPPGTASVVTDTSYPWQDGAWMQHRHTRNGIQCPLSIYEVHLGSWRRKPEGSFLGYREIAPELIRYVKELHFTHVEFLPLTEHPFYGSWGYQSLGYFSPTARFGKPEDLMYLIDQLHQNDIGVIMDWVPSHFPGDAHGLGRFDGTHLYEHADPRQGLHPEWTSWIFNYGRHEVRAFLLSSALYWFDTYHIDGIRVDAVASMLYLDYARKPGEWIPNRFGGKENLEAISFLRLLNRQIYREHPDVMMIAEESTAFPMVSRPTYVGGLGFGMKWNMGWMHDTLRYFSRDPIHRKYHHDELTFSLWYAFSENFVLPLSHDETVYGKRSLLGKMPGDDWQKRANLRLLYAYLFTHPGKKLLFMGGEFGQEREWNHDTGLDWHLLDDPGHVALLKCCADLAHLYRAEPALHELDCEASGFEWTDFRDWQNSIIAYERRSKTGAVMLCVFNLTPVPRHDYRVGVSSAGRWRERFNSDALEYGGSGVGNMGAVETSCRAWHGREQSLSLTLPPLGALILQPG